MNAHSLKLQSCLVLILVAAAIAPSVALGDAATDIQVFLSGGKLTTGLAKYAGAFDETTFETHDPGFAGSPLPQGVQYGVQISQKLWYHSGVENDPITPVRGDVYVRVSDGTISLDVTGATGLQSGLVLTGSLSGSLHGHLDFSLFPASGSPSPRGRRTELQPVHSTEVVLLLLLRKQAGAVELGQIGGERPGRSRLRARLLERNLRVGRRNGRKFLGVLLEELPAGNVLDHAIEERLPLSGKSRFSPRERLRGDGPLGLGPKLLGGRDHATPLWPTKPDDQEGFGNRSSPSDQYVGGRNDAGVPGSCSSP